ncbi:hypothetical protein [Desulfobacter sp.]|uniref:hypothetical protein n=1 Tax=Desulfobacter sp. TaxID=2294 RepID=UPI003D0DA6E8
MNNSAWSRDSITDACFCRGSSRTRQPARNSANPFISTGENALKPSPAQAMQAKKTEKKARIETGIP